MVEKNHPTLDAYSVGIEMKYALALGNAEWRSEKIRLEQNYPNPFNPVTIIRFEIPEMSRVNLKIFSNTGKLVAELREKMLSAGSYQVSWDASMMSGGYYHYKLQVNQKTFTKTMTLSN